MQIFNTYIRTWIELIEQRVGVDFLTRGENDHFVLLFYLVEKFLQVGSLSHVD